MTISTAVSFAQGFGPLALAPMFPQLIEAFDSNLTDVVQFTGVCILVLGFSNFIWYECLYLTPRYMLIQPGFPFKHRSEDDLYYYSRHSFV